jgi:hypothetical protein
MIRASGVRPDEDLRQHESVELRWRSLSGSRHLDVVLRLQRGE